MDHPVVALPSLWVPIEVEGGGPRDCERAEEEEEERHEEHPHPDHQVQRHHPHRKSNWLKRS